MARTSSPQQRSSRRPARAETQDLLSFIRDIPDFPREGILFRDLTPLMANGPAFRETIARLTEHVAAYKPATIVGIESRGFIFGASVAASMGIGFVPIRKPGKLPWRTKHQRYDL